MIEPNTRIDPTIIDLFDARLRLVDRRRPIRGDEATGEILFFTGIRYERAPGSNRSPSRALPARRKRKG